MPVETPEALSREAAIELALDVEPGARQVYAAQRERAEQGLPEFDPMRMEWVTFKPAGRDGSLRAEIRPVVTTNRHDAELQGADFVDVRSGHIFYYGTKAVYDPGQPVLRAPAASTRRKPADDTESKEG